MLVLPASSAAYSLLAMLSHSWLSGMMSPSVQSRSSIATVRPLCFPPPNPSVKGTSRKRAAPYVER
jgi:hypothetical protein